MQHPHAVPMAMRVSWRDTLSWVSLVQSGTHVLIMLQTSIHVLLILFVVILLLSEAHAHPGHAELMHFFTADPESAALCRSVALSPQGSTGT